MIPYDLFYADIPYGLMIGGFLLSVKCGFAFSEILKKSTRKWSSNRANMSLNEVRDMTLLIPFVGICIGICLFLGSGIQIFAFSAQFSYAVSVPVTFFVGIAMWYQLGQVLDQIQKGGSRALDIDAF
ncbi:MAG: hypothetical protein AAGD25_20275 [Cyanobacteria bacterium P01_F01_bin.150]